MARWRVISAVLAALVIALAIMALKSAGHDGFAWFPPCLFHRLTGFACPGCGMTRATQSLLNGRIAEAMHFHAVGVILLPVLIGMVVCLLPSWLRGHRPIPFPLIRPRLAGWVVGAILMFWFLRNLPRWPFTWLGPP